MLYILKIMRKYLSLKDLIFYKMDRTFYTKPTLTKCCVTAELGFASSYALGTPGTDFDFNDYQDEL